MIDFVLKRGVKRRDLNFLGFGVGIYAWTTTTRSGEYGLDLCTIHPRNERHERVLIDILPLLSSHGAGNDSKSSFNALVASHFAFSRASLSLSGPPQLGHLPP